MGRKNYYLEEFDKGNWPLPVVPVCEELNPFAADGVLIYVVLGYLLPYDTMKFLAVVGLLRDAKVKGRHAGVDTHVEATSGATGVVLAHLGPSEPFGVPHVVLVMNEDVPHGKKYPPQLAGAKIVHPDPLEDKSAITIAREMGQQPGWLNLDQYANPANATLYRDWAAPKVLEVVPNLNVFVGPVGTGGTIVGFSGGLRERLGNNVTVVGAMLEKDEEVPGVRDMNGMKEITLPWREAVDDLVFVKTRPSYLSALWFQWLQSLIPGVSGGLDYAGTLLFIKKRKDEGTLDALRGKDGKVRIATVFHDNVRPYATDRFTAFLTTKMQRPRTAPPPWTLLWEERAKTEQ